MSGVRNCYVVGSKIFGDNCFAAVAVIGDDLLELLSAGVEFSIRTEVKPFGPYVAVEYRHGAIGVRLEEFVGSQVGEKEFSACIDSVPFRK